LKSRENAEDFKNDLLLDAKELYEAITKDHRAQHAKLVSMLLEMADHADGATQKFFLRLYEVERARVPDTTLSDGEAAAFKRILAEYGIEEKARPKTASRIAGLVQQSEDFDPLFKICSKLMHRTSLSIASSTTAGGLDEAALLLRESARSSVLAIYLAIKRHIEEIGIRPTQG
jgi:hypothetical protein